LPLSSPPCPTLLSDNYYFVDSSIFRRWRAPAKSVLREYAN
jgi:hypothetical protein